MPYAYYNVLVKLIVFLEKTTILQNVKYYKSTFELHLFIKCKMLIIIYTTFIIDVGNN